MGTLFIMKLYAGLVYQLKFLVFGSYSYFCNKSIVMLTRNLVSQNC